MAVALIDQMAEVLGCRADRIAALLKSAPEQYRTYTIPKKEPGKTRLIAEPPRDLKTLQRWFAERYLARLPVHRAATAYRPGSSIVKNAAAHRRNAFVLTMDFQDFFPSIRPRDLRLAVTASGRLSFSRAELRSIDRLLFWKADGLGGLRLSAGAPSSPAVSNAVMHGLDTAIAEICRRQRVRYTRYADDLTFSANGQPPLLDVFARITGLIGRTRSPRLKVNKDKTAFSSKSERRQVTGLTLTPDGRLSIGRERKALIREQVDLYRRARLPEPDRRKLSGLLAFARDVEPRFVEGLARKHGAELIDRIRAGK